MVVVKINDKILLYIFGYFGLYTFGSCIPLGLVYLWLVYLWLCIPLGDIPALQCDRFVDVQAYAHCSVQASVIVVYSG